MFSRMWAVTELRQYTLHPGTRPAFVSLFERTFVESQEQLGIRLLGQFEDRDDPDRFIWIRSFPDMPTRKRALTEFYYGPVWAAHRDEANAMMVDSDNVHLLQPVSVSPGQLSLARDVEDAGDPADYAILLRDGNEAVDLDGCASSLDVVAVLRTLQVENNFPQLPVITDPVTAVVARRVDTDAALPDSGDVQIIRLRPTPRSALR
jgi:hypothetical protein